MPPPDFLDVVYTGTWFVAHRLARPAKRKTDVYEIMTHEGCEVLGTVRWYVPWRRYAFFPASGSVWETTCLTEVCAFLARLRQARVRRRGCAEQCA